jgi:hypothetical protein
VIACSRGRLRKSSYNSKKLRQLRPGGLASSSKLGYSKRGALRGLRLKHLEQRRRLIRQLGEPRNSRLAGLSNTTRIV